MYRPSCVQVGYMCIAPSTRISFHSLLKFNSSFVYVSFQYMVKLICIGGRHTTSYLFRILIRFLLFWFHKTIIMFKCNLNLANPAISVPRRLNTQINHKIFKQILYKQIAFNWIRVTMVHFAACNNYIYYMFGGRRSVGNRQECCRRKCRNSHPSFHFP